MATPQSDSRQTLRPIPVVRIEDETPVPERLKGESESLRPVAGPAPAGSAQAAPSHGAIAGLSRQSILRWTVASGILGVIAFFGGIISLWQPGPHAASPVFPDAVRTEPASAAQPDPTANPERAALAAPAPPPQSAAPQSAAPSTNATKRKAATPAKRTPTATTSASKVTPTSGTKKANGTASTKKGDWRPPTP